MAMLRKMNATVCGAESRNQKDTIIKAKTTADIGTTAL